MKILLLGGDAFTGPHILRALAADTAASHALTVFDRGQQFDPLPPQVQVIPGDLAALHEHASAVRALQPDVVLHMNAMTAADANAAVATFAGYAGRIVIASSQEVYAPFGALLRKEERPSSGLPLSEDSPLRTTRYLRGDASESIDVEEIFLTHAAALPVTILRVPITYGPGDPHHRFFPFLKRMDDARPAILLDPAHGNFRRTHAYVENVAHAFALALTHPAAANRIYNIGEAPHLKTPTVGERLHELARAARYRGQIVVVPRDQCPPNLLQDLDFRHDLIANDQPLRRELGYAEVVDALEGFRRTIAWQRAHPPAALDPAAFNYAAEDEVLRKFGLLPRPKNS